MEFMGSGGINQGAGSQNKAVAASQTRTPVSGLTWTVIASFNPEPTATASQGHEQGAGYQAVGSQTVAVGSGLNEAIPSASAHLATNGGIVPEGNGIFLGIMARHCRGIVA
jgi:hypothetical protein